MALATPAPHLSDPCLQYFGGRSTPPPADLYSQYQWSTDSIPFLVDLDLPFIPPTLLPSCTTNLSSCSSPVTPQSMLSSDATDSSLSVLLPADAMDFSSCSSPVVPQPTLQSREMDFPSFSSPLASQALQMASSGTMSSLSVPPALVQAYMTFAPPSSSPIEPQPVQMTSSGATVGTPTMHPNLVNTLKEMIHSYPTSSSDMSGGRSAAGWSGWSSEASSRRCGTKRKQELIQQQFSSFPDNCFKFTRDQFHHHALEGEIVDDEAAVVPVDLIENRRPFQCAYEGCNKTFKNPQTMRMHHKTHYSEESSCRLPDVNKHVMTAFRAGHNKKIPSRCPICRMSFVGLYELRRHYGRKHSVGEKKFGCKKCPKKFYIEVDLRDHMKLCGEPLPCKCGQSFAFKCNLVNHKKGHPECQDPPTEGQEKKSVSTSKRQQRKTSSRSASRRSTSSPSLPVKASSSPATFCSMSSSPSVSELAWSPLSPSSEDFSSFGSFSPDVMSFSSDCTHPTGTSSNSTVLSSRPASGIYVGSSYVP